MHRIRTSAARVAVAGLVAALLGAAPGSPSTASPSSAQGAPSISKEPFGSTAEGPVDRYTLTNASGMRVRILTYGGILQSIDVPDRHGQRADVALCFDNLTDYMAKSSDVRCIIGLYTMTIMLAN